MSARSQTVIVPTLSADRCRGVLASLEMEGSDFETIVVDNRNHPAISAAPIPETTGVRVLAPGHNLGYSAAVNLAAREAKGDSLILLNDDCVVDQGFVSRMAAAIDPASSVTMAAGVMRQSRNPELIDSAGMELDKTLLVFDYLNGRPISVLEGEVPDPVGPSGAAAAFDRESFLEVGGFDENLFAYWEDVDLVLRLRERGGRCRLVADARGTHEHSATLGSGSAEKNRLMGFGRGYVLRKWGVLTPSRVVAVVARDLPLAIGQVVVDRNVGGLSGRMAGLRTDPPRHRYPEDLPGSVGLWTNLRRRLRRRGEIRSSSPDLARAGRAAVVFHTSLIGGPVKSLVNEIRWLSSDRPVEVVVPEGEPVDPVYRDLGGELVTLPYSIVSAPEGSRTRIGALRRLRKETRMFRAWFRSRDIELVFAVTTVLPSVVLAARLEQIPVLLYAAEIPPRERRPGEKRLAALSKRLVMEGIIRVESRIARKVIVCSPGVAPLMSDPAGVTVHYPPIEAGECTGDGVAFRSESGIPSQAPLLACIGSISRGRGQHVLISALPRLLEEFPDLRVLISGAPFPRERDLSYSAELDQQIRQLGLGAVVIRRERTAPVGPLLSAADVAVNPATTHNESFGRVAFEAGLAGTPMVATARGVLPELHQDGETILLVPPSDPEALGEAIAELLRDDKLRERIASGAARLASELASPEVSLEAFQGVIGSLDSGAATNP